jgi:Protein of unknown function (DUF2892)
MSTLTEMIPATASRVEANTSHAINARIAQETRERLAAYRRASREELTRRLQQLDREWDIERALEANAATVSLAGGVLALAVDRRFAWIPVFVGAFLLQHAVQGWCPPLPFLRRAGVRTSHEINEERLALMRLRGDFDEPLERPPEI